MKWNPRQMILDICKSLITQTTSLATYKIIGENNKKLCNILENINEELASQPSQEIESDKKTISNQTDIRFGYLLKSSDLLDCAFVN